MERKILCPYSPLSVTDRGEYGHKIFGLSLCLSLTLTLTLTLSLSISLYLAPSLSLCLRPKLRPLQQRPIRGPGTPYNAVGHGSK